MSSQSSSSSRAGAAPTVVALGVSVGALLGLVGIAIAL
jgi:hypothetical protein